MSIRWMRCKRCGGNAHQHGEPHELRLVVFEEATARQDVVVRMCGRCKASFGTSQERDEYLEGALLA